MTPFHQSTPFGSPTTPPRIFGHEHSSVLSQEQVESWRTKIHECDHPVLVLDSHFKPLLRNHALRSRLSEPSTAVGTNQPMAFIWQTICDTAERIAAQHAKTGDSTEIAEAFPVNQRCFVAIGSLLRDKNGVIVGAVINFADLSAAQGRLLDRISRDPNGSASHGATAESHESFQKWANQRELALKRMSKLSRRESQVVSLVSDGLPNKSIARELDISVKTIEKHRANATRKLGVSSTAEMVRIAVIAGNKTAAAETPQTQPDFSQATTSL